MKRFKLSLIPILIVALFLVGCPPPDDDSDENKPATPEEIRQEGQEIVQAIDQILSGAPSTGPSVPGIPGMPGMPGRPGGGIQPQQLRTRLQTFREKHGSTETGQEMIGLITSRLYNIASLAFDQERYQICVQACDLILVINPTHVRAQDLKRRALDELNKPRLDLNGFYTDDESGKLLAFVEVLYLQTGQRVTRRVQVGEEFDGYRFKKVVTNPRGKAIGIVVRYIKTGREYELRLH